MCTYKSVYKAYVYVFINIYIYIYIIYTQKGTPWRCSFCIFFTHVSSTYTPLQPLTMSCNSTWHMSNGHPYPNQKNKKPKKTKTKKHINKNKKNKKNKTQPSASDPLPLGCAVLFLFLFVSFFCFLVFWFVVFWVRWSVSEGLAKSSGRT